MKTNNLSSLVIFSIRIFKTSALMFLCFGILFIFSAGFLNAAKLYETDEEIVIENDYVIYKISKDGYNAAFIDKQSGKDYYDQSRLQPFMGIHIYEHRYFSSKIFLHDYNLTVYFGQSGITANVKVTPTDKYFVFELENISDPGVDECILARHAFSITEHIGGSANACWNDKFGACVMALDLPVQCNPISYSPAILQAKSYKTFGLTQVGYSLIGAPSDKILLTMGDVEREQGLPHPTLGGVWGKISPEVKKSYLFVDFYEANIDKMIEYAKAGGFGYIMMYWSDWGLSAGHYKINPKKYPHGLDGIKMVADKIHALGMKIGIHTIIGSVTKNDPYVTPVPDSRLVKDTQFILAKDIYEDDQTIEISSSPGDVFVRGEEGMPLIPYYDRRGGTDLLIDSEIITYRGYSTSYPYKFTDCIRGNFETARSRHKKGTPVYHFSENWNWYIFDTNSSLLDEQTSNLAHIINYCGIDMVYFDGVPQFPHWYHMPKVWTEVYRKSERELLIQSNSMPHGLWHIVSRGCSGDWVSIAPKAHFDHNRLGAYRSYSNNFIPTEFGWYQWLTHGDNRYATFPDEVEYAVQKALAYDAAFCLETHQANLDHNGRTEEMMEIVKNYETLRLKNYFSGEVKKELQQPGREYKLFRSGDGEWYFKRIKYGASYIVRKMDDFQNVWTYDNEFSDQPIQVRLRADWNYAGYDERENIILLDYKNYFRVESQGSKGLSFSITPTNEQIKAEGISARLVAENAGSNEQGWKTIRYFLNEPVDISEHNSLGVWIYGDESGAVLTIAIQPEGVISNERIVEINFNGWKYFELNKPDGELTFKYQPMKGYPVLRPINLGAISRVSINITNIPAGKSVTCYMSPIKALKISSASLINPKLNINGQSISFPCILANDQYLELMDTGKFVVYDENGRRLDEKVINNIPILKTGDNTITFEHDALDGKTARADISIITVGEKIQ